MSPPLIYLGQRFVVNITHFIYDWYVGSFFLISRQALKIFGGFDKIFALRINFRNIFQPLYQDYSIIGHLLGLIFRLARVAVAVIFYLGLFLAAIAVYVIWISAPVYIIYQGFF